MPRTVLGADSYKDKDLSELIYIYKRRAGATNETCAKWLNIHPATWIKYMKKPSKISLENLRTIQRKLQIPASEMQKFLL